MRDRYKGLEIFQNIWNVSGFKKVICIIISYKEWKRWFTLFPTTFFRPIHCDLNKKYSEIQFEAFILVLHHLKMHQEHVKNTSNSIFIGYGLLNLSVPGGLYLNVRNGLRDLNTVHFKVDSVSDRKPDQVPRGQDWWRRTSLFQSEPEQQFSGSIGAAFAHVCPWRT